MRVNRRKLLTVSGKVKSALALHWYRKPHNYFDDYGNLCESAGVSLHDYPSRRWEEKYRPEWTAFKHGLDLCEFLEYPADWGSYWWAQSINRLMSRIKFK